MALEQMKRTVVCGSIGNWLLEKWKMVDDLMLLVVGCGLKFEIAGVMGFT
jgi:HD-like signal output (HDOD) protein